MFVFMEQVTTIEGQIPTIKEQTKKLVFTEQITTKTEQKSRPHNKSRLHGERKFNPRNNSRLLRK
jgi:hypothetical protein